MKTEVRNEFILEAHKSACNEWKLKIEKECPELFKLEVGKWYKNKSCGGSLFFLIENHAGSAKGYGFELNQWREHFNDFYWSTINKLEPATEEEVKEAFINEAKKRGFKEGVTIKNHQGTIILKELDIVYSNVYNDGIYNKQCKGIWLCMNGEWSKIISIPIEDKIKN